MIRKHIPFELLCWFGAIGLLAMATPGGPHFSLCPIANMGWTWCPGCGLGRSLIYLLHGDIRQSIQQHWLGFPALLVLGYRISQLSRQFILSLKT